MAGEMNVVLTANLTADPELAEVGGKQVARLRLAHNSRTKRGDQWEADETWWIDASVWPTYAGDSWPQNVVESLRKGDTVEVTGRLKREPWEARDGRTGVSYWLTVEQLGPSLRRQSVQVARNQRGGHQPAPSQGGWAEQPQAQQSWGQAASGFDDEAAY